MKPAVTVVIPTFNRLDSLPEVLAALAEQARGSSVEVLVVDDGSTDGTEEWLASYQGELELRVESQENRGPAVARNRGVRAANAEWVAFLGDDTVPCPGWLERLQQAVLGRSEAPYHAVIGRTEWHPKMKVTPFLAHINEFGAQFGYALIENAEDLPFNFFYTSNLLVHRERLREEPFDEGFPYPAWEDTELSFRLKERGLRICYEKTAKVLHNHPTDLVRFCARQEMAGFSAVVFYQRHPEQGPMLGLGATGPPPMLGLGWRCLEVVARALQGFPVAMPTVWDEVLRGHYIRGLHRGWRHLGPVGPRS